jgi:phosphoribosylaminoimidazole carboxylase/phosphoribosylaminoimidazole-succinocarboxamide synthase
MAEALINRGTTWTDKEVKALLAIWGDSKIQEELDGAVRNQVVFKCIAQNLSAQGIQRDWKQCRAKVKNLKNIERIKTAMAKQAGEGNHASFFLTS